MLTGRYNSDAANAATSATTTIDVTSALDANDDGGSDALSDGLLIIRFLFGLNGSALTNGTDVGTGTRQGAAEIASYLAAIRPLLDVDGNGAADALTDGLMIIRYLSGSRGPALTAGAIGTGATRDRPQIETYIRSLMP